MTLVISAIEKQGIAARAIQTAEISLTPNTNDNGTKVIDFTAANSVTVATKAIAKSAASSTQPSAPARTRWSGPTLTISDQLSLERRALASAIADARARALAIASAAHVKLGAVHMVTEESSNPITFGSAPKAESLASPSTPVQPGTVQTEEDVTVTFAIA